MATKNKAPMKYEPIGPETYALYIDADETVETTRERADDGWDNGDSRMTVYFRGLRRSKDGMFFGGSVAMAAAMFCMNELWLVVIRYGTGSTFGHDSGLWEPYGVAPTERAAEKMRQEAEIEGPKKWNGFFDSFEDVEVHRLLVTD